MVQALFTGFFGVAAIWFGVVVFRTSSMVRSALALLFSMTAIGAMFLAMQAEFLGVLQIMMMATEMGIMAVFMMMYMMDPGGLGAMDMTEQTRLLGLEIMERSMLIFETAGVTILTAMIAATAIAIERRR